MFDDRAKPRFRRFAPAVLLLCLAACQPHGGSTLSGDAVTVPPEGQLANQPIGDFAGASKLQAADEIPNPLAGNPEAVSQGHALFISMNCAGCHGYDAKGGMGPNLTDRYWRYGGAPSNIYKSIYEGRPQGMPAWGRALPPQDIWKLVAFIQTLGGAFAEDQYHSGLQGDNNVTSVASEANSAIGAANRMLAPLPETTPETPSTTPERH